MPHYVKKPKTTLDLANEIKKACDDYWSKTISEQELKEILEIWADRIFDKNKKVNITIQRNIGKKRKDVVEFFCRDCINNNFIK